MVGIFSVFFGYAMHTEQHRRRVGMAGGMQSSHIKRGDFVRMIKMPAEYRKAGKKNASWKWIRKAEGRTEMKWWKSEKKVMRG